MDNEDLEKAHESALVAPDVTTNVMTFLLWCHNSIFGVATLHFAYLCNVVNLSVDVATLL